MYNVQIMDRLSIDGLSQRELNVYSKLLSVKTASITELAKISGLKRSTLYRVLDELTEKVLVSKVLDGKKWLYVAEQPETLVRFSKEQEKKIQQLLPDLLLLEGKATERPQVKLYEGAEGIKSLYESLFQERQEIVGFSNPEELFRILDFQPGIVQRRVSLKIPIRLIMPDTPRSRREKRLESQELRQIKLSRKLGSFRSIFLVCGKKVVMFSLGSWLTGVMVENNDIAAGYKAIFETFWELLD